MNRERQGQIWPLAACLLLALMLTILPLPAWAVPFGPHWVVLTLIYWILQVPHRIGVGAAWVSGLALDTLQGALLGQHALALTLVAYFILKFHLRIRVFPIWQQTMTVLMLVAMYEFLIFWVDGMTGSLVAGPERWLAVLASAAVWPLLVPLLGRLQRRYGIE